MQKFCLVTLISHVVIIVKYDILMSRMWDIVPHNYYSLGEILHFIIIICKSFSFLSHFDVGNDSVLCC